MSLAEPADGPAGILMALWHAIGGQLRHPNGLAGHLVGLLMRYVNERPNRLAIAALQIRPQDTVLELGFGPGRAIELIASQASAGFVYGIDQSPVMLEQAQRRNRAQMDAGRVFLYQAPFERLPFEDRSIDKVLAVNVVYFWEDVPAVLREIRRVLRPGGSIVIYATDASTMQRWKFAGPETHRLFDAATLGNLVLAAGFDASAMALSTVRVTNRIRGLVATITMPPTLDRTTR